MVEACGGGGGCWDEEKRGLGDKETGGEWTYAYEHSNLTFTEVPAFNFLNFSDAVKAIVKIPFIFFKIFGAMRRADHLHLRCPGNVGLAGLYLPDLFSFKTKISKICRELGSGGKTALDL